MSQTQKPIITLLNTPVTAEPSALISPIAMFGLGAWFGHGPFMARFRQGLLAAISIIFEDTIHTMGHIISSRHADAPMDSFHLAAPFPSTIYHNNDVSPEAHRMRAMGGPIASILALGLTLLLRSLTKIGSIGREFLNISAIMHALIGLGSLMPLPFLDGGTMLKWTEVKRGRTPDAADAVVEEINLTVGLLTLIVAMGLTSLRHWKVGLIALFHGLLFIGVGLGRIKQ